MFALNWIYVHLKLFNVRLHTQLIKFELILYDLKYTCNIY